MRSRQFLPLAFETHGLIGQGVLKLLQRLAALTKPGIGLAISDMVMELQITLVKATHSAPEQWPRAPDVRKTKGEVGTQARFAEFL